MFRATVFVVSLMVMLSAFTALGGEVAQSKSVPGAMTTGTTTVYVNASDALTYSIQPNEVSTYKVHFVVYDPGTVAHTFTVSAFQNMTAGTNVTTGYASYFSWPYLYADQTLNASQTLNINVTFREIGYFEIICRPHFSVGMYTFLGVGVSPNAGQPPAVEQTFWIIIVAITGLAMLAVILGFVYGKRGSDAAGPTHTVPHSKSPTSQVDYYNDSRPEPLDSAEPSHRGPSEGGGH